MKFVIATLFFVMGFALGCGSSGGSTQLPTSTTPDPPQPSTATE